MPEGKDTPTQERLSMPETVEPMRPGQWQANTLARLEALGYAGFNFGPGVMWWPIDHDHNLVAGPFITTDEFDAWLTCQELL
jgi:hypothetical protein